MLVHFTLVLNIASYILLKLEELSFKYIEDSFMFL